MDHQNQAPHTILKVGRKARLIESKEHNQELNKIDETQISILRNVQCDHRHARSKNKKKTKIATPHSKVCTMYL